MFNKNKINEYKDNLTKTDYYLKKMNKQKYGSVNYLYGKLSYLKHYNRTFDPSDKDYEMDQKTLYRIARILFRNNKKDVD